MITIIIAACLLYCSAPSVCSASGGYTNSLLSKQEINPPIPSMADLDQDPDMPALMNSDGGGPCTKWQLDALMRKMEAYKAYVEAGGCNRSDPGVFKDVHGFWRTSDGYISPERPAQPIIISPPQNDNRPINSNSQANDNPALFSLPPSSQQTSPPLQQPPPVAFIEQTPSGHSLEGQGTQFKRIYPITDTLPTYIPLDAPPLPSNMPAWIDNISFYVQPSRWSNRSRRATPGKSYKGCPTALSTSDYQWFEQFSPAHFAAWAIKKYGSIDKEVTKKLFYQFALFQFPAYLNFLDSLDPVYREQTIIDLYHDIQNDSELSKGLECVQGYHIKNEFRLHVRDAYKEVMENRKQAQQEKEQAEKRQQLADELRERDQQERDLVEIAALADNGLLHQEYGEQLVEEFSDEWDQLNDPEYERILRRHKALEEVIMNSALKTTRRYAVDEIVAKNGDKETIGYCQELHGTAYQHVLQEEFNELYEKSCRWRTEYNGRENLSTYEFLHNMLEAGIGFNHHNFDGKATLIADCCWGLVQGGGLGLFHSVAAKAPVLQPLYRLQSSVFLGTLIAGTIYFAGDICLATCTGNTTRRDALLGIFSDGIATLKKTSRRDAIRNLTAFGVELVLSGKINNAAQKLFASANKKLASKFPGYNKAFSSVQDLLMNIDADLQVAVQAADMLRSNAFASVNKAAKKAAKQAAQVPASNPNTPGPTASTPSATPPVAPVAVPPQPTVQPATIAGAPISKSAAKKIAKMAQKQQYKMQKAAAVAANPAQQAGANALLNAMKKIVPQPKRLVDALGNPVLTPCGRPVIELGGFKFADLYDHEYQKILDMFKNHVSGITLTKDKIQHIVFGEFKKNGTHTGGHIDIGGYALKNNGTNISFIQSLATGMQEVAMQVPGKTLTKGYFPSHISPIVIFEHIEHEICKQAISGALKNIPLTGLGIDINIANVKSRFCINYKNEIVSCFPSKQ